MIDQSKWQNTMTEMAKESFETGMRMMGMFHEQAEKAVQLAMDGTKTMQDDTRTAVDNWMNHMQRARKAYWDTVEEGMERLTSISRTSGGSEKKAKN